MTGLPWYLTIPLFALSLNLVVRLPALIYARKVAVKRQILAPLNRAWAHRDLLEAQRAGKSAGAPQGSLAQKNLAKANIWGERLRRKRWGVQMWKLWAPSLGMFPFWLLGIEAVRRSCGGPRGFLGSFIFGASKVEEAMKGTTGEGRAAATAADVSVDGQGLGGEGAWDAFTAAAGQGEGQAVLTSHGAVDSMVMATGQTDIQAALAYSGADMSMATGGCLWFPDLLVADPYHILPFALSAVYFLGVMPSSQKAWRQVLGLESPPETRLRNGKWRMRLQRSLLTLSLAVGPLTMDLPAAIHLYWLSSAVVGTIESRIIWRLMPLPKVARPAKRDTPVMMFPTREKAEKLNGQR
ncbi:hypothetical protein NEMBOFW57_004454 [Staphylotrichum longicolle]|uniref:Uncharacterized protein n=1 Tax=Staphylotrichum longicolle TaxID=669026 RepID=A0AAD4FBR0_9PEZI|nr:hypothetical protein NEMBOFW57_004454 [Staphylotrichum longicolle]